jgi:hypothetical protein
MYKVLIVDDEKDIYVKVWLIWLWEAVGLQVAGCCSHRLEALQFIAELAVDIRLYRSPQFIISGNRCHSYDEGMRSIHQWGVKDHA